MAIYPVILCGGSGTRLWPVSRPSLPKQFAALVGEESTFLRTVRRFQLREDVEAPVIVAGPGHLATIREQLRQAGSAGAMLIEPQGRDSAPAIAAAACWIAERDPEGIAVVVAADHHIPNAEAFCSAMDQAIAAARRGAIVTFGVQPTEPSSAYGYIRPGAPLDGVEAVCAVEAFVEKPDAVTAQRYIEAGYLWNSGNFVFEVSVLLREMEQLAPSVLGPVRQALAQAQVANDVLRLGAAFIDAQKISIDFALMEKTRRAAVLPVSFAWSDLGAWDAIWAASEQDELQNAASGRTVLIDARGCLVRGGEGKTVAVVGVSNLAIVVDADAVLVCELAAAQRVKDVARMVSEAAHHDAGDAAEDLRALSSRLGRWLRTSALPLWWSVGADHHRGGFHELIGQDGWPVDAPRRLRVQARQTFVYALAAACGWSGPAPTAVQHGLDYLLSRYRRDDGLFRTLVDPTGAPLDDTAMLYDQAFVLLALASAYEVLGRPAELLAIAQTLLTTLLQTRAHAAGGFVEASPERPFQSNPHMHLLEAALAWSEAGGGEVWDDLADAIVQLALSRFIDPAGGFLREFYDAAWAPARGVEGRVMEPGHQFEWAWLLERWSRLRGSGEAGSAARRLYRAGEKGVDPQRGVAMDALLDDDTVHLSTARLWPQTERLKAGLILMEKADDEGTAVFRQDALEAATALSSYLDTPVPGLWRDKLTVAGSFVEEPAPASSLYHLAVAVTELSRSAEENAAS